MIATVLFLSASMVGGIIAVAGAIVTYHETFK